MTLRPISTVLLAFLPLMGPSQDRQSITEGREAGVQKPEEAQAGSADPAQAKAGQKDKKSGEDKDSKPEYYGTFAPGKGFTLASTEMGEVKTSLYFLVRYHNQLADKDTFTDHFGNERRIVPDPRNDIQVNRVLIMFSGWVYNPKFRYFSYVWTSDANLGRENQVLIGGNLSYQFSDAFNVFFGIGPMPGTRSNLNVWPYFLGTDRRMADESSGPHSLRACGSPEPHFQNSITR